MQQVTRLDSITSTCRCALDRRWVVKCRTQSFITCKVFHLPRQNRDGGRDGLGARTSEARVSHSSGARTSDKGDLKSRSWGKWSNVPQKMWQMWQTWKEKAKPPKLFTFFQQFWAIGESRRSRNSGDMTPWQTLLLYWWHQMLRSQAVSTGTCWISDLHSGTKTKTTRSAGQRSSSKDIPWWA